MNLRAILQNLGWAPADVGDKYVATRTAEPTKGVQLGVPEEVLFDVELDVVRAKAATWCWWRLDDIKRKSLTLKDVERIRADGQWRVRFSDLVEKVEREAGVQQKQLIDANKQLAAKIAELEAALAALKK